MRERFGSIRGPDDSRESSDIIVAQKIGPRLQYVSGVTAPDKGDGAHSEIDEPPTSTKNKTGVPVGDE